MSLYPPPRIIEASVFSRSPQGITTTNVAFGGEGNRSLFITESETGTVLRAELDVPGACLHSHS